MKLASLSLVALLAAAAPALADVADPHPAVAFATIQDQNLDGIGDVLTNGSTTVQLGPGGEDRAVLEFDITSTLLPNFTDVRILVRVEEADGVDLGQRQFDFVLYPADGVASLGDFQVQGTVIDSQGFDTATESFVWLDIDVTAEITAMMQANVTHAGLRVQATSNPSGLNAVPPLSASLYFQECVPQPGVPYCFGDGSGPACPCGNTGAPGSGCATSVTTGATLFVSGAPQLGAATPLQLTAFGAAPNRPGMFLSGTAGVTFPVGDGLLCAGGSTQRFELVFSDATGAASTSLDIAAATGVMPGDERYYQYWFRDPGGPCGGGFNFTHGVKVTWF